MNQRPQLSVVVALVSGKKQDLHASLSALHAQTGQVCTEIIVPYDDPCADVTALASEFPSVRFIRAEGLDTREARAGGSREHHDTLRTIGIRAATADIIALTEDHARLAATWREEIMAALARHPRAAAVGGAVECLGDQLLNWAVWFCDFGRYQNPLPEAASTFVSDSNVAYRRIPLETVEPAWRNDYHETIVHSALLQHGFELWTSPHIVVWQTRQGLALGTALQERYVWARSFAGTRARLVGTPRRWLLAVLSPALPVLMTWRLVRTSLQRGQNLTRLSKSLPLIILLQTAWAIGEFTGYVTGRPA